MRCHLRAGRDNGVAKLETAINVVLPLPVKIFLGLRIWAANKPNAVLLFRFAVERHVNAAYRECAMDRTKQNTEGR